MGGLSIRFGVGWVCVKGELKFGTLSFLVAPFSIKRKLCQSGQGLEFVDNPLLVVKMGVSHHNLLVLDIVDDILLGRKSVGL